MQQKQYEKSIPRLKLKQQMKQTLTFSEDLNQTRVLDGELFWLS